MPPRIQRVKHSSVREGDRIRVEGVYGDMDIRREGTVARIVNDGVRWSYVTVKGFDLFTIDRNGNTHPDRATIDLMARNADTPLFEWTN